MLRGGTLFSGIGTPEVACPEIDWRWCAEIDPFACAVLQARFPHLKNLGDVGKIDHAAVEPVDLVVFGSPCQSFSVAGRRRGLDDPRGDLALVALALIGRIRPRWVVFENVPGLLSQNDGRDFGTILGALGECGFGFAYRVLDAQFAGVPQRRRRVFAVGCLGDWRGAAAVLFEPESLRGDPAPRREAGQRIARPVASCVERSSGYRNDADTADNLIAHAVRSTDGGVYHEDRDNIVADPISAHEQRTYSHEGRNNFRLRNCVPSPLSFTERTRADGRNLEAQEDLAYALCNPGSGGRTHSRQLLDSRMAVRRLMPVECERLQGFPDGFTLVTYRSKPAADGPRYRALGNAMCVNVIKWILKRIQNADSEGTP